MQYAYKKLNSAVFLLNNLKQESMQYESHYIVYTLEDILK